MPGQRTLIVSDPIRIRALTHPLRLELLDILRDGPATATECAEATGESVASCSFHLRTLAKYGYIEEAERRGREKPWRLTADRQDLRPLDDPDSVMAVRGMAEMYVDRAVDQIRLWLARVGDEPNEWVQASSVSGSHFWATAEELADLARDIQDLTARFDDRRDDPELRPEGVRPARLFAATHVDVARERRTDRIEG